MFNERPTFNNIIVTNWNSSHARVPIALFNRDYGSDLCEVYKKPSKYKKGLFEQYCNEYMTDPYGSNFHICSHGKYKFSVGWVTLYEGIPSMVVLAGHTKFIVRYH